MTGKNKASSSNRVVEKQVEVSRLLNKSQLSVHSSEKSHSRKRHSHTGQDLVNPHSDHENASNLSGRSGKSNKSHVSRVSKRSMSRRKQINHQKASELEFKCIPLKKLEEDFNDPII